MQYNDGTSTGIEPYFSFEYFRASRSGSVVKQTIPMFEDIANREGKDMKDVPYLVTAQELRPSDHVKMQSVIQKWVDSSISKTANCPNEYTVEDTKELYDLAYDLGCKGCTIYRDGSRMAQVLATSKEDAKLEDDLEREKLDSIKNSNKEVEQEVSESNSCSCKHTIQKRPKRLHGFTDKIGFAYGDHFGRAYVTVNIHDGNAWEVFISTKEKEVSSIAKALGLMTTKLLRLGGTDDNMQQAIDTLSYDQNMGTLPFAVANILKQVQKDKLKKEQESGKIELAKCSGCGENAYDKANCICHACGISKCN